MSRDSREDFNAIKSKEQLKSKKSGNWGLDEIDCHWSHMGQCTSTNYFSSYLKKFRKKKFEKKIL